MNFLSDIPKLIKGELETSAEELAAHSHDASLFELVPKAVIYPADAADVCALVTYVAKHKTEQPGLSLTGRSAGTDMSGGAINDSLILDFSRHFKTLGKVQGDHIATQPGVFYRDFEPVTLAAGLLMPSYPASRELCMMGGIVSNDSGGEKSLVYGKVHNYVTQVKAVLADGQEHTLGAVKGAALNKLLATKSFEGKLHQQIHALLTQHAELIAAHKPRVSKNSTGYNVWDAWDGTTLDLSKLIVGSQGTLGMVTEATFRLVPAKPLSGMVVAFLPRLQGLGEVINQILAHHPSSLESFDDHTIKFAFRFFFGFRKTLGWRRFILLGLSFIPVLGKLLAFLPHWPKLILLIEFEGDDQATIDHQIESVQVELRTHGIQTKLAETKHQEEKFWIMRRESFNILRKNVKDKHTAPFIDDLVVPPETLPEFLPRLTTIMERYQLLYTIAGHVGDGNFHIIPLMDLTDPKERAKIQPCLREVTSLVLEYHGSLSGEHNDGLIRGPFLEQMYGPEMMAVFREVKRIFDPQDIFNPHKKVTADWAFSEAHMRERF